MRTDDEMSVQESERTHVSVGTFLRRVKRFHQMFLWPRLKRKIQCRQLPRVAFGSNVLQIRWTVWNLRNVVTKMILLHFRLIIMI